MTGEKGQRLPALSNSARPLRRPRRHRTFGDTGSYAKRRPVGTFTCEDTGSIAGVTYDTTKYKVVVSVTDNGTGNLTGTTKYFKIINGDQVLWKTPWRRSPTPTPPPLQGPGLRAVPGQQNPDRPRLDGQRLLHLHP